MKKQKVVLSRTSETVDIKINKIPKYQVDRMCKVVLEGTARLFEDPAVRADFERWKKEEAAKAAAKAQKEPAGAPLAYAKE